MCINYIKRILMNSDKILVGMFSSFHSYLILNYIKIHHIIHFIS